MSTAYAYTNFAKGELSPQLRGRIDVEQYYASAETLKNCMVRPYGNVINRAGSRFVSEVKDSTKTTRLLKFIFSVTESYIIEFGENYFRFYTNNGQVQISDVAYEVAHTYTEAELFDVHFAQRGDVIYLAHPDHAPATLTRTSSTSWTLADITFFGGPYLDDNDSATTVTPSATTGSITLTASTAIFDADHVGALWKVDVTVDDIQGYVRITAFTDTTHVTATVVETLSSTTPTTIWAEGAWSDFRGYPASVTFHESRLAWARTAFQPQNVWLSKSSLFDDYTPGSADDSAINVQLNTEQANDIKWISSGNTLAVGTFGGEFVISAGASGLALTPSNVNAQRQTGWGSENIIPKKISNYTYYVQRGGRKIRELYYYWDLDNYKSVDMTILAEHITLNGIIDMDYQQNPDSILWCVKSDGEMCLFTRDVDQEIQAWTPIITDGSYESVQVIPDPSGEYDQAWVVVNRTIEGNTVRYVEYFDKHDVEANTIQYELFYVDSGLSYNAYELTDGVSLTVDALTGSITATAGSAYFDSSDVNKRIRVVDSDGVLQGEMKITGFTSSTVVTGTSTFDFTSLSNTGGLWGVSVDQVTGATHLALEAVAILADGGVQNHESRKTVASDGSVTLDSDFFYISLGLPYDAVIKTNPIEAGSENGTAQGKLKRIFEFACKVYRTLGILVGESESELDRIQHRDPQTYMGVAEALYTGEIPNVMYRGDWDYTGQIVIKQPRPLPMNMLGIYPKLTTSDKA